MNSPRISFLAILFLTGIVLGSHLCFAAEGFFFRSDYSVFVDAERNPRIHTTIYIPYHQLHFSIADSLYEAEVDISVILYAKGTQKGGEIWRKKVVLDDVEKTYEHTEGMSWTLDVPIEPGEYEMQVTVRDAQTGRGAQKKEKITVDNAVAQKHWISAPAFFLRAGGMKTGLLIANNLDVEYDSIYSLVQIVVDSASVGRFLFTYYAIDREKERKVLVNEYIDADSMITWKYFLFKPEELEEEDYTFLVELSRDAHIIARNSKLVSIIYPFFKSKLFLERVEQMVYIADGKEMKELKEASIETRESLWNKFWSKKDPIPETPENETSDEYYKRVDYANENFKSYTSGWRTDRGRIYIIYGQPDDVEYHPFEEESVPYQIWYYYGIGKRFIFADLSMTGDYTQIRERDYDIIKK